jgi:hypothetical protein
MDDTTNAPEVIAEQTPEQSTEEAEASVAELHKDSSEAKKPTEVPISRLNKEIQRRKEAEAELKALKAELEGDGEVATEDIDDEPEVKKLAQKLEQIEERERRAKLEVTFMTHLNKALDNAPEYKDVVNVEVIKAMAFDPKNANKTYSQLIQEAYGNAVTGRRTIETTTPRGGAKDSKVDIQRASSDATYRREVLADPELRKQYNENLHNRIPL